MKEKIIFAILISSLIFPSTLAAINYNPQNCRVNNCPITISDCSNGLVDIFSSSTCSGNPLFEYSFSSGNLPWYPASEGIYYMYALCDDGHVKSICSQITVSSLVTTSSSSSATTESTPQTIPTPSGNSNIILYVLVIVIIVVVAFIAYRIFTKKKPKVDYASLYRKWGR